jgi:hypothetical protein
MAGTKAKRRSKKGTAAPDAAPISVDAPAESSPLPASHAPMRSPRVRAGLIVVAAIYLSTVWLDAVGSTLPLRATPRVWLYFCQIAALFAKAGQVAIDYRAEGWSCESKRWVELDLRPWFRIDADNKENRFHRALQFYRKERKVMRALEDYIVQSNNASPSLPHIGGVRFLSLRVPYPAFGSHVEHGSRKELAAYPAEQRHSWYYTPTSRRKDRCGDYSPPSKEEAAEAAADKTKDKEKSPMSPPRDDKDLEP